MSALNASRFAEFYKAVHGKTDDPYFGPFPWQERLALRVGNGDWPRAIALPTAAGKTTCIDVAVFALACKAKNAARRIFFVVDRRIVVDQATIHADNLQQRLDTAPNGILREIADILREMGNPGWMKLSLTQQDRLLNHRREILQASPSQRTKLWDKIAGADVKWVESRPLDVYALRGGMYREKSWARSPLQPTFIASTVDQVGSRLLFRGYGVTDSMKPLHAGLVGNDSLILLDEAHCAKPFDQTMQAITKYRTWDDETERPPFCFVSLTATPSNDIPPDQIERDNDDDRKHKVLGPRIAATKPAKLVVAEKATGKQWRGKLVEELAEQARELMGKELGTDEKGNPHFVKAIGVIVNRVATARNLAIALRKPVDKKTASDQLPEVILLTGRMRPIDRDAILKQLEPLFSGKSGEITPTFVVATQCLEVGADLDFHALITECASLDALRQRFGRLNRVASRPGSKAVIVIRGDQQDPEEKPSDMDPVYGNSLAHTWKWLKERATDEAVDFGIAAMRVFTEGMTSKDFDRCNAPAPNAPILFPAHLDCWVQTNPKPKLDPDPALFLHGPQSGMPDVQVVFRGDLGDNPERWADIVALCPPSSSEAVPVRIDVFRKWLVREDPRDDSSDVEGERTSEDSEELETAKPRALRWKGPTDKQTEPVTKANRVRPNETYVVPTSETGLESLGDFQTFPPIDHGEEAFQRSRDKAILRLQLLDIKDDDEEFDDKIESAIRARLGDNPPEWLMLAVEHLAKIQNRTVEPYPHPPQNSSSGFVVVGKRRLHLYDPTFLEDDESFEAPNRKVTLKDHSSGVTAFARKFAEGCGLEAETYTLAGLYHDIGKLDPRFQAMLQDRSPRSIAPPPLAKSGGIGGSRRDREEARKVHHFPSGGRHELLSTALVAKKTDDDLLLHLIATHHGSARPFVDPLTENEFSVKPFPARMFDQSFSLESSSQEPAEWNAILPERFWRVVRKFGWWGSAYREAVFRLADHAQSQLEQEKEWEPERVDIVPPLPPQSTPTSMLQAIPLIGLEGSNPLGFLAALGALRTLSLVPQDFRPTWLKGPVKLSWGTGDSPGGAVLHLSSRPDEGALAEFLAGYLERNLESHPVNIVLTLIEAEEGEIRRLLCDRVFSATSLQRESLEWVTALFSESAPNAASQLLMVRRDYLKDNLRSVMNRTVADHLRRSLYHYWDYADALENQSLHWEPSEDRRHAYQWSAPSGDPARKRRGGMLGANRLALEAWPLFLSLAEGEKLSTRGFLGNRANNTSWTWPLWSDPLNLDCISSLLSHPTLQDRVPKTATLQALSIFRCFRCRRILVGKTPNLTPTTAV